MVQVGAREEMGTGCKYQVRGRRRARDGRTKTCSGEEGNDSRIGEIGRAESASSMEIGELVLIFRCNLDALLRRLLMVRATKLLLPTSLPIYLWRSTVGQMSTQQSDLLGCCGLVCLNRNCTVA